MDGARPTVLLCILAVQRPRGVFLSGSSSSMAKKKVVRARRRKALAETNLGGLSPKTQGIAARQPSLHLCYQATIPSHSGTGQQKTTSTPSCHNMGALRSSLPKGSILQRTASGLSACRPRSQQWVQKLTQNFKSCKSSDTAHPFPCSGSQITAILFSPAISFPNGIPLDDVVSHSVPTARY